MGAAEHACHYARASRARFVEEMRRLVRFPSVGSQPRHAGDIRRCANWLARHLASIGLERVRLVATAGHPIVWGEWRRAPGRPTLLVYGHYDVQPAEPLQQWRAPPFAAVVQGDRLYGRGASDDKGQFFAHVKAIESYLAGSDALPLNVVCLVEGEEESGSPNLAPFLARSRHAIGADAAVVSDMPILGPRRPALTYALRGSLSLELEVQGPLRELHSGQFGGAIADPLRILCELVGSLHLPSGEIAIPGIYDGVRDVSAAERASMARNGPTDEEILRVAGVATGSGEPGFTLYERTTIRPSLSVNGLLGGYTGTGPKAVVAPRALAKLSFRLVPDQEPAEVAALFRRHVQRRAPATVRVAVRADAGARPVVLDPSHPALRAALTAYRRGFGAEPALLRAGGTVPVVNVLRDVLHVPTALMGFTLPDDGIHAANERLHLPTFFRAVDTSIAFLDELPRALEGGPPRLAEAVAA
jgi:acetylornithine deacetylase/succinyl-diaminopimelate desuccinylase-like protein